MGLRNIKEGCDAVNILLEQIRDDIKEICSTRTRAIESNERAVENSSRVNIVVESG